MKNKLINVCLILGIFLFLSCKKEEIKNPNQDCQKLTSTTTNQGNTTTKSNGRANAAVLRVEELPLAVQRAIAINANDNRFGNGIWGLKQRYLLLSNEDKELLWKNKINAIIANDFNQMTTEQQNIVLEVRDFFYNNTMETLFADQNIGIDFLRPRIDTYGNHFTDMELFMLLELPFFQDDFSLFNSDVYLRLVNVGSNDKQKGTCYCYWSIYCIGDGYCSEGQCFLSGGCGIGGSSTCTGTCSGSLFD